MFNTAAVVNWDCFSEQKLVHHCVHPCQLVRYECLALIKEISLSPISKNTQGKGSKQILVTPWIMSTSERTVWKVPTK